MYLPFYHGEAWAGKSEVFSRFTGEEKGFFAMVERGEIWRAPMDVKTVVLGLTVVFTLATLYFGTRNGFYDTDNYHGNGSAH